MNEKEFKGWVKKLFITKTLNKTEVEVVFTKMSKFCEE
jgi:hypothetical protein